MSSVNPRTGNVLRFIHPETTPEFRRPGCWGEGRRPPASVRDGPGTVRPSPKAVTSECTCCHAKLSIHYLRRYRVQVKVTLKMKAISRRQFLKVTGAAMLTAALPAVGGHGNGQGPKRVRARPLSASQAISSAERAFYQRARFETAADAMRAVASRGMTAEIYVE